MSTTSFSLSSLARSKLSLSVGAKDTSSLHRWVLLKNSIIHAFPITSSNSPAPPPPQDPTQYASTSTAEYPDEEEDAFVFPADGVFVDDCEDDADTSEEAQWLDSLLETLGDEDDDDFSSVTDDSQLLSPLPSPMSSSDDLSIPAHYLPLIYPPYHPPLVHPSYQFPLCSAEDDDPLPYQGQTPDDLEVDDMSMPEAIEDTSDDESDGPETPLGQSSLLYLPARRQRLPPVGPLVYVGTDDSQFYPFDLDPLPFASPHQHPAHDETYSSNTTATYQEC